jgi:cardiolipin synthase
MLNGGVHVRYFGTKSQLSWYQKPLVLWRQMVFRNHRKLLVIDERIAYLGGVNISARSKHWKDFHMRIVGKTVPYLLRVFANSYVLSGGNPQLVASYLSPMIKKTSGSDIHYVFDYGRGKRSAAKRVYRQALDQAQDTVYLCTPYYAPGKRFIRAIKRALKRGVRVVLIIPEHSDIWITQVTALPWLQVLSSMGVEIYQTHSMVHGKGVVVDDRWAMIGSSNLHQASFRDNYEANARITKKEIVKDIRAAMHALIDDATAFSLEDAQKTHSWMSRALGSWFSYLNYWWYQ